MSSDTVVFVSTPDSLDLQGLANLFREYEGLFEDKAKIVLNKVFPTENNGLSIRKIGL